MEDQRIDVAQAGRRQAEGERFHEAKDGCPITGGDLERKDAAIATPSKELAGMAMLRMVRKAGVMDPRDSGVAGQGVGNLEGAGTLALDTEGHRL